MFESVVILLTGNWFLQLLLDPIVVCAGASVDSGVVGQSTAVAIGYDAGLDIGIGGGVQANQWTPGVALKGAEIKLS